MFGKFCAALIIARAAGIRGEDFKTDDVLAEDRFGMWLHRVRNPFCQCISNLTPNERRLAKGDATDFIYFKSIAGTTATCFSKICHRFRLGESSWINGAITGRWGNPFGLEIGFVNARRAGAEQGSKSQRCGKTKFKSKLHGLLISCLANSLTATD